MVDGVSKVCGGILYTPHGKQDPLSTRLTWTGREPGGCGPSGITHSATPERNCDGSTDKQFSAITTDFSEYKSPTMIARRVFVQY